MVLGLIRSSQEWGSEIVPNAPIMTGVTLTSLYFKIPLTSYCRS